MEIRNGWWIANTVLGIAVSRIVSFTPRSNYSPRLADRPAGPLRGSFDNADAAAARDGATR